VRLVVVCLIVACIGIIPMRIIGHGFMPGDDALRHAGKVISGKNWNEVLVIRDDIKMDNYHQTGWHAILNAFYKLTDCDQTALVNFSVITLFLLFSLVPIFLLKRPEAWAMSFLTIVVVIPSFMMRILLGRPYIFTMAVILVLCLLWPKFRSKKIPYFLLIIITVLMAASTWIHCAWYLLALPFMCFFLAREWRAGIFISIATIIGIAIGASFTGHPYLFLKQNIFHAIHAFGSQDLQRMLVTEFRPYAGNFSIVIVVFGLLGWRMMRGAWNPKVIDNPVFIMAILCWILGFVSKRFWIDWGMPAIMAWMALEFQEALNSKLSQLSWRRIFITIALLGTLFLCVTNDAGSRWTNSLNRVYLSLDNSEHAEWLPEPGGIVYSDSMGIFYSTFFKNPHASWRYVLGFEPAIMPPDDLAIYRKIQMGFHAHDDFDPWVKKMKPEDRLIIGYSQDKIPKIPELEWHCVARDTWIGRLSRDSKDNEDVNTKLQAPNNN
jgi:hypothetical protein